MWFREPRRPRSRHRPRRAPGRAERGAVRSPRSSWSSSASTRSSSLASETSPSRSGLSDPHREWASRTRIRSERIHREGPISFAEFMEPRCTSRPTVSSPGAVAPDGPGATSSRAPRSARCSGGRRACARRRVAPARAPRSVRGGRGGRGAGPARGRRRARRAGVRAGAALRARRALGQPARRAARAPHPRAARRSARPVVLGSGGDDDRTSRRVRCRQGPIVTALDDLPAVTISAWCSPTSCSTTSGHVVERAAGGWLEVRVDADDDGLRRGAGPGAAVLAAEADLVAEARVVDGARAPGRGGGPRWLERVARCCAAARSCCSTTSTPCRSSRRAARTWMRTYRAHQRGGDPLDAPGTQDITCDVPLEYLRAVADRVGLADRASTSRSASGWAATASPSSSRKATRCGRRGAHSAISRRSPGGAAASRPPRSPIPVVSARTGCSSCGERPNPASRSLRLRRGAPPLFDAAPDEIS